MVESKRFSGLFFTLGLITLLLITCSVSAVCLAQSQLGTGAISGTVTDPSNQVVADATVTVTNTGTGMMRTVTTSSVGAFTVPVLPTGEYSVKVEKPGFAALEQRGVVVNVGGTVTLILQLNVGTIQTVVEVSATAALIETTRTSEGSLVTRDQIDQLPINGRRYDQFALLAPGVTRDGSYGNLSYHGISGVFNNFTVEGNDDNSMYWGSSRGYTRISQTISINAIQEFQVGQSNFLPEFGRAVGGNINAVVRSGSNTFHFDGFEFLKNSALSARDPFASFKPDESRHQFGGSVSGPVKKDTLFFFVNYDQQIRDFPLLVQDTYNSLTNNRPTLPANPTAAQQAKYTADLNAWQTGIAYIKSQFPGGAPGNTLPRNFNEWLGLTKVDWLIGSRHNASFSYNYLRHSALNGIQTSQVVSSMGGNGNDELRNHTLNMRFVSTISPILVNEARFQWAKDFDQQLNNLPGPSVSANSFSWGPPSYLPRRAYPDERKLQAVDNISVIKGSHALKFGFEVVKSHELIDGSSTPFLGAYSYSTATSFGYDLLNKGLGCGTTAAPSPCYSSFQQTFGLTAVNYSVIDYAAFAQDSWKMRRNLSMNYGVRWDYQKWPAPQYPNPAFPETTKFNADLKNVGPRAGIAWDIFGNGKTVVRGGYGIMFGRSGNSMIENALRQTGLNDPTKNTVSISWGPSTPGAPTYPNVLAGMPSAASGSTTVFRLASDFRRPRIQSMNIGIERLLPWGLVASVSYIYTYGDRMQMNYDVNMIPPNFTMTYQLPTGATFQVPYSAGMTRTAAGVTVSPNASRPNPSFGAINVVSPLGKNWYRGLLVEVKRRFANGFAMNIAYTLAKAENLSGSGGGYGGGSETGYGGSNVQDQFNLNAMRAASGTDQRNRLTANAVWQPKFHNNNAVIDALIRNYRISGIITSESGRPFSPSVSLSTLRFQTPDGAQWQGLSGGLYGQGGLSVTPGFKRNSFYGPWAHKIDLRISREIHLNERFVFELMGEGFNLFNHSNFLGNNSTMYTASSTSSTTPVGNQILLTATNNFATPNSTSVPPDGTGARRFQLSLRFHF